MRRDGVRGGEGVGSSLVLAAVFFGILFFQLDFSVFTILNFILLFL